MSLLVFLPNFYFCGPIMTMGVRYIFHNVHVGVGHILPYLLHYERLLAL